MPSRRKRVFLQSDRERFFAAIVAMRQACIEVCTKAQPFGYDYRVAQELKDRIDDAVGALTGDREALWGDLTYGPPRPKPRVLPIES